MQVAEVFAGFTPGEADGLRRAMSRKRSHEMLRWSSRALHRGGTAPRGRRPPDGRTRVDDGRGLRGLWLSQGAQRRLRAARLPVDLAAGALRRGVPVCASERAADGLLRSRQPRPRGRKSRHRGAWSRRERLPVQCAVEHGGVRLGLGYIKDVPAAEMRRLVVERERNGPFTSLGELAGRVACRRGSLEQLAWSGACDGLPDGRAGLSERTGARPCGSWGWPRRPRRQGTAAAARRARSWRCRWSCRRRRGCARSDAGSG